MKTILSIDQGTSSSRAILFTKTGQSVTMAQETFPTEHPQPGWVEQDPEAIWQSVYNTVKQVLDRTDLKEVLCCGITNQRETTVLWDKKTGKTLGPAIVWQDRRTRDYCHKLSGHKMEVYQKTGLLLDPYFSASKIQWFLENNPEAARLAEQGRLAFGTVDSFLIWRLSGGRVHATDISNASRTLLFNIHKQAWDDELLALFQIPKEILPEVKACDAHFADVDPALFGKTIPITGVAGDQQAALVGQACFKPGMMKATFGTGGFLLMHTGDKPVMQKSPQLLSTIAYQLNNQTAYGLEGSIYHAGTTIKWLRDELGLLKTAAESETLAASLPSNEGVYLVSSFTGLAAPHWVHKPSALIVGLSQRSKPAHFARAALEGLSYQVRDVLSHMQAEIDMPIDRIRVDGGMTENQWFLQFLANQCQSVVERPDTIETSARGVAFIAALGMGLYRLEDIESFWQAGRQFLAGDKEGRVDQDYAGWRAALKLVLDQQ